ncbi:MAG: DUF5671 domain-containing protein [Nitrososphaerales archaeon]
MTRGRRTYLYTAALFGLVVSLISLISFLWRFLGEQAVGRLGASPLAGTLASPALPWLVLFLVAFAAWIFHISIANQAARPLTMTGAAERAAPERKMYLYMGRLAVVAILAVQAWLLIRDVVTAFLDNGLAGVRAGSAWPVGLAAGVVASLGYYIYLRVEAGRDGDLGHERGAAALWRRAYTYLAALVAALLTFAGGGELVRAGIRVLMTPLSGDVTWHAPAAAALAALVVGLPLGAAAWGAANRAATMNPPAETNALSRVLLRYDGVLVFTLVTLIALGYLVEQIILRAISRPVGNVGHPLLGLFDWPWALAYLPVAALMWISFANGARVDAAWGGERPRTAGIRRVVRYLLTAISLAAFWYGLTAFTQLILQVFLGADTTAGSAAEWVQRFATSAAFLLVGAPAWWGHWWSQQMRVRSESDLDATTGVSERGSLVRRVYLGAVVLVGAVIVVAAAGFAAFLALNWRAANTLGGVRAAVAGAGAAGLVALFWTLIHGLMLRSDLRFLGRARGVELAEPATAVTVAPAAGTVPAGAATIGPAAAVATTAAAATLTAAPPATQPSPPAAPIVAAATAAPGGETNAAPPPLAVERREYRREDLEPLAVEAGLSAAYRPAHAFAVVDGADGAMGARLLAGLRSAFPDVVLWPLGLNEVAQAAMIAALDEEEPPVVPEGAFGQVAAILAPSDVLIPGALDGQVPAELVDTLARTNARIILLPPRDARLRWVAAPKWPLERWVENAVTEAGNALSQE